MASTKFSVWLMWLVASFFYAYQYVLRVIPSVMITNIMSRFNIDAAVFGQFSGVYYLGYSLMHIPLGFMLDRIGPKKILPMFIFLTVVGTAPLVLSDYWVWPVAGRFLVGIGSSAAILGVFKIVRLSFGEKRFAMMLSWSVTIGLIGAIYGGAPLNYLQGIFGFKAVLYAMMALGLALAIISYFVIPHQEDQLTQGSLWRNLKLVISNKKAVWVCICAGFMVGPCEGFADVWGAIYLQTVYGLDKTIASSLPSFIFIGMACGGPILSFFAAKINNYLWVISCCGILMSVAFIVMLTINVPIAPLSILFGLLGVLCAYQILAIYVASTYVAAEVAGLMSAVANMLIMTFGYIFHTSIGTVVDMFSGHDGYLPLDSALALTKGISVVPIALLIGSAGFVMLIAYENRRTS